MNVGYKQPSFYTKLRDIAFRYRHLGRLYASLRPRKNFDVHYIIGHYSSGTTLLDRLISMHPACARLHTEGVQLVYFLDTPEDYGQRRFWIKAYNSLKRSLSDDEVRFAHSIWCKVCDYNTNTSCVIEKSVVNILRISDFLQFNDKSKVIHIHRKPEDIIKSYSRRKLLQKEDDLALLKQQINLTNTIAKNIEKHRIYSLDYSDLMKNPVSELQRIYRFLGLHHISVTYDNDNVKVGSISQKLEF